MNYLSVCSGVEAATAAWHQLGWKPVGFSEIEKFPSAVLQHHYPHVTNYGDMTKYKEWNINESVGLLVGGTPCQSFSVAGLRKGLEDPRGNLALTYGAIADKFKPAWIVWENVPGVLSSNGGKDFACFLDMLEELGYICDIDILDAQFFGVPQRRRRVFVCGQHRDYLLKQKTDSSRLTIYQCLVEILHGILIEKLNPSEKELQKLGLQNLSRDGVLRRIKLFCLLGENNNWQIFQNFLIEDFQKHLVELKNWDATHGEQEKEPIQADLFLDTKTETQFTLTEESLKKCLAEVYEVMKLFTTLTETNLITDQKIFMCSKVVLLIGKLILLSNQSCPTYWSATSSTLTALKEYINYARQASNQIFEPMEWIHSWGDFLGQADGQGSVVGCLGDWESSAKVLFESDCLRRDTPPSREKREEVARPTACSSDKDGGVLAYAPELAPCLETTCHDYSRADGFTMMVYETHPADSRVKDMGAVCQTVTSRWGTGGGNVPLVQTIGCDVYNHAVTGEVAATLTMNSGNTNSAGPKVLQAYSLREDAKANNFSATPLHVTPALQALRPSVQSHHAQTFIVDRAAFNQGVNAQYEPRIEESDVMSTLVAKGPHAVAQSFNVNARPDEMKLETEVSGTLTSSQNSGLFQNMAVRRLTPVECERLQGFPDNFTNIPWNGKEESPDSHRYKAMGNSMAVPCMRWLGQRIEKVEHGLL